MRTLSQTGHSVLRSLGYELRRTAGGFDAQTVATVESVRPFTMTSPERIAAMCDAVRYIESNSIPGAVVECGVWAGGSSMAAARTLLELGNRTRELYLYDTFDGMSAPGTEDEDIYGRSASVMLRAGHRRREAVLCYAPLNEVQANMSRTGYPSERIHFVEGKIEDTVPSERPSGIALLRLDTDWYESTRHELEHLAALISANGILIIDDYGHWRGARRAVDEWLQVFDRPVFLSRIDYTGRIAVIPG